MSDVKMVLLGDANVARPDLKEVWRRKRNLSTGP